MIERYIITSAVNNTKVFSNGFSSLITFAKYHNAELLVLPIYYNLDCLSPDHIVYDDNIVDFLQYDDVIVTNTSILPSLNIRPTTIKPLSGLGGIEGTNNIIVGSPRLHVEHLPSPIKGKVRQLLTTGCITASSYSNTKVGKRAEFTHSYGAVIIEVTKDTTFIRQISIAEDGTLCDLDVTVNGESVTHGNNTEAIVFGDVHELFIADVVKDKGFFGDDSLVNLLKPNTVVLHDLIDTMTVSHHHKNSPFTKYRISNSNITVVHEILSAVNFLKDLVNLGVTPMVISSNHNSHLTYWLENAQWKDNYKIAKDILRLQLIMLEAIDTSDNIDGKTPDIFKLLIEEEFGNSVIALDYNEDAYINTFKVDSHGDKGLNGSRGFKNIGNKLTSKMIIGHAHTASRVDGLLTVGVSCNLSRNYTYGVSTWSHTHAIIHVNNRAQLVTQDSVTGAYTLPPSTSKGNMKRTKIPTLISPLDYRYKVVDDNGNIVGYFKGYRGIGDDVFSGSEWKGRELVRTGRKDGFTVEYL